MRVIPAGSSSTLLFRELLTKLQVGTLQDKVFSLRGLNSIVQVNEHTSIMLLKTEDFAKCVFLLCRSKESLQLRLQALKFLRHLASGGVCRRLLLSRGALEEVVDLVIGEYGTSGCSEEFLVVAAEYLAELLDYDTKVEGYGLSVRAKEKLERTLSFLRDSSYQSVRNAMAKLQANGKGEGGSDKNYNKWKPTSTPTRTPALSVPSRYLRNTRASMQPNVLQVSSRVNHQKQKGDTLPLDLEELAFNQRLENLKFTLTGGGRYAGRPLGAVTNNTSAQQAQVQVQVQVQEGEHGAEVTEEVEEVQVKVNEEVEEEDEESKPALVSVSEDSSSSTAASTSMEDDTSSEGEEGESEADEDVGFSSGRKGWEIKEVQRSVVKSFQRSDEVSCSESESSSSLGSERSNRETGFALSTIDAESELLKMKLQMKRGAQLYKYFSGWMQVAEKELLIRQKIKMLRRLFNQNNRNRRLSESFYAWRYHKRQVALLSACLSKWTGFRLCDTFKSWQVVVRERRRNARFCDLYNQRRMYRLMANSFAEWRNIVNIKIFTTYRDMKAKYFMLEDEVDDLRKAKSEGNRFKDHLYSVLFEVSEIGVNLLRVENGGAALIDCCAKVENILKLNSAYVPAQALDSAMASIDWSSLGET